MREFQDDPRSDEEVGACFLFHLFVNAYMYMYSQFAGTCLLNNNNNNNNSIYLNTIKKIQRG